jgi:hypothetical protein
VLEEIEDVVFEDFDFESVELGVLSAAAQALAETSTAVTWVGAGFGAGEGEAALVGEAILTRACLWRAAATSAWAWSWSR